jgi:hypothetical protein
VPVEAAGIRPVAESDEPEPPLSIPLRTDQTRIRGALADVASTLPASSGVATVTRRPIATVRGIRGMHPWPVEFETVANHSNTRPPTLTMATEQLPTRSKLAPQSVRRPSAIPAEVGIVAMDTGCHPLPLTLQGS